MKIRNQRNLLPKYTSIKSPQAFNLSLIGIHRIRVNFYYHSSSKNTESQRKFI